MTNFKSDIEKFRESNSSRERLLDNVQFTYWLSGEGDQTFVLLPGGMGSGEFYFRQIQALEKEYRVLTLDYPLELKDNNNLADGIMALIESLNLSNIILVGQSYGGMIAQVIAKRHPLKIAGFALSNTGTASDAVIPSDPALQIMISTQRQGSERLTSAPYDQVETFMLGKMNAYLDVVKNKSERCYLAEMFRAMIKKLPLERNLLMTGLLLDFHENQRFIPEDFSSFDNRSLLIFSPDDYTFSKAVQEELIRLMPYPTVNQSLSGGHLAITINIEEYISVLIDLQKRVYPFSKN